MMKKITDLDTKAGVRRVVRYTSCPEKDQEQVGTVYAECPMMDWLWRIAALPMVLIVWAWEWIEFWWHRRWCTACDWWEERLP